MECRIANLEDHSGGHYSKKICEDVPTEKCVPVPVKIEGQKCVNIPTQSCETVPVTANNPVPKKQCFKKPRKVCQTLVSTKPKIVTAKIPKEVCSHGGKIHKSQSPSKPSILRPSPKLQKVSASIPSVQIQPPISPRYPDLQASQRNPDHNLIDIDNMYIERFVNEDQEEQDGRIQGAVDKQHMGNYLVDESEEKHFL